MENKKILFVATLDTFINTFYKDHIKDLNKNGWIVDIASNGSQAKDENVRFKFKIKINRSPISISNIKAIWQLRKIVKNEIYDIIHCHTPMGSVVARLAVKRINKKTKIIYTAHGFHFYKGAGIFNWLFYYPIEKVLSYKTDMILTINKEDYLLAKKKFKKAHVDIINGVGVNQYRFTNVKKILLNEEFPEIQNPFIVTCIGELNNNKNQKFLIEAFSKIVMILPNVVLALVGEGKNRQKYEIKIRKLGLNNNIKLLGYRKDVPSIINESDIIVSSSKREGLPVSILEALVSNKLVLVTKIRGHIDIVVNKKNGFLYNLNSKSEFVKEFMYIYHHYNKINKVNKIKMDMYYSNIIHEELIKKYNDLLARN